MTTSTAHPPSSVTTPVAAEPDGALSFLTLVRLLRQSRRAILLSGLVGLVLAAALAFSLSNRYTATASFIPPSSSGGSGAAALMSQLSSMGGGALLGAGSHNSGDLYVGMLKSDAVARDLVQRFNLLSVYKQKKLSQTEKILAANSLFSADSKTSIVTINVTDAVPERACDLANGYLQALQSTSAGLSLTESSQRRAFYEQRLSREKNALADAEVALKQTEEKSGVIAPAGQTMSQIQTVAQLQAQITGREVSLASMLQDETDQNPDVIRMHREIASLRGQLAAVEDGQAKGQFSTRQAPGLELDYVRAAREVKYHEALFTIIANQYEVARLDEARDAPLQVLDKAVVPDTKSGPHRTFLMLLGLFAGLAFGVARTIVRTFRVA